MQAAFAGAKAALSVTALLDHPSLAGELALYCDASASHTGAVLQQRQPGQHWRPLGLFSQKLSPAETRYSTFDWELLAVYSSLIHFRHLLEGRHFTVFSDHKPLAGALEWVSEPRSDRQRRQLSFIAEFVSSDITVADTLSRPAAAMGSSPPSSSSPLSSPPSSSPPSSSTPSSSPPSLGSGERVAAMDNAAGVPPTPPVSVSEIAAAQPSCADCVNAPQSSVLRVQKVAVDGQELLVDTSSGVIRPLISAAVRRRVFDSVHGLAHPGIWATTRLISSRFL
jgi:RNase H-like domain found in reverse transcriptase